MIPEAKRDLMYTEVHDVALEGAQEGMVAWIETHWATLAAIAWRGYVATGRGLVLLDGAWDAAVAVGYLTAAEAEAAGSPWPGSLQAATQAYRPDDRHPVLRPARFGATLLGLRATAPRVPPCLATQRDGAPLRVSAA